MLGRLGRLGSQYAGAGRGASCCERICQLGLLARLAYLLAVSE